MRGLDWSNSSYVRLYRQDTPSWKRLRWEGQAVYTLLLRHVDRAGCLPLDGLFPHEAVSEMTGAPESVCERALPALLAGGFLVEGEGRLIDPEFLEREEAAMSDAQRKRDERQRRRDQTVKASHFVTGSSRNVTKTSRGVTDGHDESQAVTPSVPSVPSVPAEEEKTPPTPQGETRPASRKPRPKGRKIPPVTIPDELAAIGFTPADFVERVTTCSKTKPAATWQSEVNAVAAKIREHGALVVLDLYRQQFQTGYQGIPWDRLDGSRRQNPSPHVNAAGGRRPDDDDDVGC